MNIKRIGLDLAKQIFYRTLLEFTQFDQILSKIIINYLKYFLVHIPVADGFFVVVCSI